MTVSRSRARPYIARKKSYPSVERSHKADRLPSGAVTPLAAESPPAPPAPVVSSGAQAEAAAPASPAAEAAPPAVEATAAPQAQPLPPQAEATPQAEPAPPQTKLASAADEEDAALADKPPEIPAPGETEYGPRPLGGMSYLDADATDRSSAIYFGSGVMGSPSKLQSWAPGAEPILVSPSAELAAQ